MGHGVTDWTAYVKRFQELCPEVPFVLEIISYKWSNEAQYLQPEFWSRYPKAKAHEFARFIALAKGGSEYELPPGRPDGIRQGCAVLTADVASAQARCIDDTSKAVWVREF